MPRIRVKINSAGARAVLRSEKVRADLDRRARQVAEAAGGEPDFEVESQIGSNRARASVRTATFEARKAEAEKRALLRALDAGRS